MTRFGPDSRAQSFRSAVEADDVSSVEEALHAYLTWFGSEPRSLVEVAQARDLMEFGIERVSARRSHIAAQLARLATVSAGYGTPRISRTWRLDG